MRPLFPNELGPFQGVPRFLLGWRLLNIQVRYLVLTFLKMLTIYESVTFVIFLAIFTRGDLPPPLLHKLRFHVHNSNVTFVT